MKKLLLGNAAVARGAYEAGATVVSSYPGTPSTEITEEDVMDFCLDIPRYKRPRKIIFADVPRNPTGKIEKPKLRKIYCGDSLVAQQNEIKA